MFKGIRLTLVMTSLFTLALPSAFAKTPEELMRVCMKVNGKVQQSGDEYKSGDKTCVKMRCNFATSGEAGGISSDILEGAQPDGSGGFVGAWQEVCKKSTDWMEEFNNQYNVDVDVDGDLDWDGGGGGQFYIDGVLVTQSEWKRKCVKKNGKIRRKCTRGKAAYDDVYYDADIYGPGGGGGGRYVIVRNSDGSTFRCTYDQSWDHCLQGEGSVIVSVHGDADHCVNCERGGKGGGGVLSGIAEIAGAVLPPLAYLGSNWLWSDAYLGANQAWAGAAATGFEQCQIMQTNHMNSLYGYSQPGSSVTTAANGVITTNTTNAINSPGYFASNELPFEYIAPPGCNGYHLGGFAGGMGYMGNGMGGFGNPWMSAGYSPGFAGGMYGPYGMYNPYGSVIGMGGMGGMGMGYPGMGGMGMGYPGMGGGIGINLGLGGMGGMGMGYPGMGGMGMGYPGMGGGIGIGMGGMGGMGYPGMGGMGMGYPGMGGGIGIGMGGMGGMGYPGMGGMGMGYPGMGGGIGINGGIGGGIGGYPGGGYYGPGGMYGGGMYGYPGAGGAAGMGTVPWGNGAGSYWNGSGGWGAGGYGGYGNNQYGANYGNIQQSYALNQQALAQGSYYQQAALQNSYNQSAQNLWSVGYGGGMGGYGGMGGGYGMGGYGYAPYSPSNMGLSMNLGWGFGF